MKQGIVILMPNKNKSKKSKASKKALMSTSDQSTAEEPTLQKLEEDSDSDIVDDSSVTEKKTKKNFADEYVSLLDLRSKESDLGKLIREKEDEIRKIRSDLKKNRREQNSIINKLGSVHNTEIKVASKERRRRNGNNVGGFNKQDKVPEILCSYLDLDKNTELKRSTVFHLLHEKFKSEDLKDGQTTILNKKNAKALGYEDGHVIEFKSNQTFLASFYNNDSTSDKSSSKKKKKNKKNKSSVDV